MPTHYLNRAALCIVAEDHFDIIAREGGGRVKIPRSGKAPTLAAMGLGLDRDQRHALGLPDCQAVDGGTFLAFASYQAVAAGLSPPFAPTDFVELALAELWPLANANVGKLLTSG
jgi:hypothetical protein